MSDYHFQPIPLDDLGQGEIPVGMGFCFSLERQTISMRNEEILFGQACCWCEDNFGADFYTPARWMRDKRYFLRVFIRHETDAAAFKLRWC